MNDIKSRRGQREGSASADIRIRTRRCISRLHHASSIAAIAVESAGPERAAVYIVRALQDVADDVSALRTILRGI